jgi:hypothetical protein
VSAKLILTRATASDNAEICRLLQENPLGGAYSISLERVPDVFAGDFGLSEGHDYVLAREQAGNVAIGVYERTVWRCYVNGQVKSLPYLGALRVAQSHRHRIAILRDGYQSIREIFSDSGSLPFALTSITSDNDVAIRILTRGLKGLPTYRPAGSFSTFILRPRRGVTDAHISPAGDADLPELAAFLAQENARFQFSLDWPEQALSHLGKVGLPVSNFLIYRTNGLIRGCIAVWDQRAARQSIVRTYPPFLHALRRPINMVGRLTGLPRLPPVGQQISQATLSHLAVLDDDPDVFCALIKAALHVADRAGFGAAIAGFATARALRPALKSMARTIEYRTSLFVVHWPEGESAALACDERLPHPEIGLL